VVSAPQRLPALYKMSRMIVSGPFTPDKVGMPAAVEVESLSLSWECACGARRRTHARAPWPQRAAVQIVDGWSVIDDSFANDANGTFTTTAPFTNGSAGGDNGHWDDTSKFTFSTGDATWTFLNLVPNKEYEVAASWSYAGNRATDPFYTVQGGAPIVVNQRNEPSGGPVLTDNLAQDISFELLTSSAFVTDGTLTVVISPGAGSFTVDAVADAVAIRIVPEPSSTALLGLGLSSLLLRRKRS